MLPRWQSGLAYAGQWGDFGPPETHYYRSGNKQKNSHFSEALSVTSPRLYEINLSAVSPHGVPGCSPDYEGLATLIMAVALEEATKR
jgi:hypothetical protein